MDATTSSQPARSLTHKQSRLIVVGVLLPIFMGSLDTTVLASALPTIGRAFGDFQTLPWLITAYLIASTAVTPLYGKLCDIRGRQFTLTVAILTYMAGSLVCALAPNMLVLVLGRILHGLGGGGLSSTAMVVLGDVAAPKERARYYAYFSVAYTTAGVCGPALGGFIADYLNWTAIFWLNIPLGLIALTMTSTLLRRLPRNERPHRLDIIGAVLIVAATVAFMMMLNIGGIRYSWASLPVLGLAAAALVIGIIFVFRMLTAPEPLIPIAILRDPIARDTIVINAFGWGAIIGLNVFLPMYLQTALQLSATEAGLSLMVLMGALNASAGTSSYLLGRTTHYKILPTIGLVLAIASVLALAWQAGDMTILRFELLLIVIGIGFGPIPPLTVVVLQNTVAIHQFGTAVGTMTFTRNLCATVLVAIFGAIVLAGAAVSGAMATNAVGRFPAGLASDAAGFRNVFLAAAASLLIALILLIKLKKKPLQTGAAPENA
jgi:MFS family permease